MKLSDIGEDAVVEALTHGLPAGKNVIVGPGDDCAVLGGKSDASWLLLKTDAVIEGVHFHTDEEPERVGWKALCRAISDVAAMGGVPGHAVITLGVPGNTELDWARGLYAGLRRAAKRFGVGIVGGETCRSPAAKFINVSLTGTVERSHCILRSGGKAGDFLYVTGRLGGSLHGKHLDFTPRLAEARWLAENHKPAAMMDLSDGLGADLPRLAAASGCGHEIWPMSLPCTRGSTPLNAMNDGEDFELLFAIRPKGAEALEHEWKREFPELELTRIGQLTKPATQPSRRGTGGFDHFRKA
jgi:thiamine-monophosphate kinase